MTSSIQGVTDTKYPYFVKETKTLYLDWRTTLQARQLGASRQAFELTFSATGAVQSAPIPAYDVVFERNGVVEAAYTMLEEKAMEYQLACFRRGEFVPQAKGSVDVMIDHCDHLISYMVRTN